VIRTLRNPNYPQGRTMAVLYHDYNSLRNGENPKTQVLLNLRQSGERGYINGDITDILCFFKW
jgi:hypothetical protein